MAHKTKKKYRENTILKEKTVSHTNHWL